jgi:RNA polymerase sigma-70 factor (ECF subfamily)
VNSKSIENPDELLPTRRSLIERLRDLDDQPSWREFFDTYWKLIYGAAIRAGLSDQEAEDVVQETVIGVARKMPDFKYDPSVCSFKGWLMHVTRCRIVDRFRRRRPQNVPLSAPRSDTTAETTLNLRDPAADVLEGIWNEEWQKNLVDVAMERVRRRANPEHYQIFHLHAVKGLGVRDVAKLTGASLPKVYVTYHRVANQVKAEVRRLEQTAAHARG